MKLNQSEIGCVFMCICQWLIFVSDKFVCE